MDEHGTARLMMRLPIGGSKTIIAEELLADWLTGGRKTVWPAHRWVLGHLTQDDPEPALVPAVKKLAEMLEWTKRGFQIIFTVPASVDGRSTS